MPINIIYMYIYVYSYKICIDFKHSENISLLKVRFSIQLLLKLLLKNEIFIQKFKKTEKLDLWK